MLKALQYFKENRLACAIPVLDQEQIAQVEDLHKLLSLKIEETLLGKGTTVAHLTKHGIEYVGELYVVNWKDEKRMKKTVYEFLWSLSLPVELDPAEVKWIPPYVNRDFMWRMQQPLDVFIEGAEYHHNDRLVAYLLHNCHYMGEVLSTLNRKWSRYGGCLTLGPLQAMLHYGSKLRAGMYCPNWQNPPEPPK